MKQILALFVFVTTVAGGLVAAQTTEQMTPIVSSYLEIHAALAADRIEGVKSAAAAIAKDAGAMGTQGDAVVKAARAVESAADIKAARAAFGSLSDAVIAAAKTAGLTDVKVAYCPMAGKSWLQKGDKIENPYYGSSMLTCGEFKK